jgi:hypothetical protein
MDLNLLPRSEDSHYLLESSTGDLKNTPFVADVGFLQRSILRAKNECWQGLLAVFIMPNNPNLLI